METSILLNNFDAKLSLQNSSLIGAEKIGLSPRGETAGFGGQNIFSDSLTYSSTNIFKATNPVKNLSAGKSEIDRSQGSLLGRQHHAEFKLPKDFGKTFNLHDQEEIKNYLAKNKMTKPRKGSEADDFGDQDYGDFD